MTNPCLPPEIFGVIVDWVATLSFTSVKDLALTSRCFVHRSQSHLFRTMVIKSGNIKSKLVMLETHPRLFAYVRELGIGFSYTSPDEGEDASESEKHQELARILGHLHALEKLFIRFSRQLHAGVYGVASWKTITSACKGILEQLLAHPLESLCVCNLKDIPIHVPLSNPHLKRITAEKLSSFTTDGLAEAKIRPPWDLQSLSCRHLGLYSIPPLLPFFNTIAHLALEIAAMQDHITAWCILEGLPRLESLILDYSNRTRNLNLVSDCLAESENKGRTLPSFPHLRHLAFILNATKDASDPGREASLPSLLPRFVSIITSQHPQPSLEIFSFTANWDVRLERSGLLPPNAPPTVSRERGWAEIDDMLSDHSLFPNLRIVRAISRPQRIGKSHGQTGSVLLRARVEPFRNFVVQAKHETHAALQETRSRMMVDVGLDEAVQRRVDSLICPFLPEKYDAKVN